MSVVPLGFVAVTVTVNVKPAVVDEGTLVSTNEGVGAGVSRTACSVPDASVAWTRICPLLLIATALFRANPDPAGTRLFRSAMTPLA